MLLYCTKNFIMNDGSVDFTKGKCYEFKESGSSFVAMDDTGVLHYMEWEDLEKAFCMNHFLEEHKLILL